MTNKFIILVWLAASIFGGCSGSSTVDTGNGSELPDTPPIFERSPMSYPGGVSADLRGFGAFNLSCACDNVHYGWDFAPIWGSYPNGLVPIIAVADGTVSEIVLHSTNSYQGHDVDIFVVRLSVAKEVDVHYTFEPFVEFGETEAGQWLNVSVGSKLSAGDVIGYLPKVSGNLGETLIHLDFKIGIGASRNDYVCPTSYFSSAWQDANSAVLISKLGACTVMCCE